MHQHSFHGLVRFDKLLPYWPWSAIFLDAEVAVQAAHITTAEWIDSALVSVAALNFPDSHVSLRGGTVDRRGGDLASVGAEGLMQRGVLCCAAS